MEKDACRYFILIRIIIQDVPNTWIIFPLYRTELYWAKQINRKVFTRPLKRRNKEKKTNCVAFGTQYVKPTKCSSFWGKNIGFYLVFKCLLRIKSNFTNYWNKFCEPQAHSIGTLAHLTKFISLHGRLHDKDDNEDDDKREHTRMSYLKTSRKGWLTPQNETK